MNKSKSRLKLLPTGAMARQCGVPAAWLGREADAGRIPHLRAGNRRLFNPDVVEDVLLERAAASDASGGAA